MSHRVLLIEDEPPIAEFLLRGLKEEGYHCEHATDGEMGLAMLQSALWDVAILDWRLPKKDGIEVLHQFRQTDSRTPVLLLTARQTVDDRVTGLDAGADDYLCKPFAFDELLARLRALTRRGDQRPDVVLSYSDVEVNLATRQAVRAGHRLQLTAREEALLVYFLRHPQRVLTRSSIYEAVWDEQYDGLSNTCEVHVSEVRKQLELHGPRLIHTLRGRGYMLSEQVP